MPVNDLRIAYLLQVHRDPRQLNRFIGQLSGDGNCDIYVHVDKKSAMPMIASGGNVRVLEESVDVRWGDISIVDATLCLLRSLKRSNRKYDFVCLRSGQDLLVRNGLSEYLNGNRGKIFMNAQRIGAGSPEACFWAIKWPGLARRRYDSFLHPMRILRAALIRLYGGGINLLPNRNKPPMDIYRGTQWFCLPGDVAQYVVDFIEDNPWYYDAFKDSLAPDEYFFQTLIMNSPPPVIIGSSPR
ncbi:MAG: hypothetical protein M0Z58_03940 [Nitrospiraceae bacterium]|nr:hypothetical protein [Nitrospiraceae bacterium]